MGSSFFSDLRISAKPLPRSARKAACRIQGVSVAASPPALHVVSITNDLDQEGIAKGRSASGVRISRGTSKSRAAPRICSAGFGKPDRRP